jgi:hypothetical protein
MRCFQVFLRALFGVAVFGFVLASVPLASAALYSSRQALPADTIQQFLANPAGLLSQFPNGGPQLISKVRDLVASDPSTLDALMGLLKTANPDQSSAIGTALGQVALMAVSTDPAFGTKIQTAIAQAGNNSALAAFSAVVGGDIKLAAATGGAGIGGGGESQTGANAGFGGFAVFNPQNLNSGVHNTPDTFSILSFGSGTPGTPGTQYISP